MKVSKCPDCGKTMNSVYKAMDCVSDFITKSKNHHIDEKHVRMFVCNMTDQKKSNELLREKGWSEDKFLDGLNYLTDTVMENYNELIDKYNLTDKSKSISMSIYSGSYDDLGNRNYTLQNTAFLGFMEPDKSDPMVILHSTFLNTLGKSYMDPANMIKTEKDLKLFKKHYGNKINTCQNERRA